ncbi:MAG TPA: hypothetical protein VFE48_12835 [Methylomirabilota bacterium]|nr:hypothetical protein [Methylomirabilota bacterium]
MRWPHLALVGVLALSPSASRAEEAEGPAGLRIRWNADAPASGLQAVCGRVFNDGPTDARRVRIRVEGLDDRGSVTARRDGDVVGSVWSRSAGLFCLTMAAGPASYRVSIISVDWAPAPQSP